MRTSVSQHRVRARKPVDVCIDSIIEEDNKYSIYIIKNNEILPWKDFNKNMAIATEFDLEY